VLNELGSRGTEKEESIKIRLHNAKAEIDFASKEGFWDKIVVNDKLEDAFSDLEAFILQDPKL
jgi:guanylate kinase